MFVAGNKYLAYGKLGYLGQLAWQATSLLLLFASTKFCDFGISTILQVLIFVISQSRAKFCDFAQRKVKAQLWNPLV